MIRSLHKWPGLLAFLLVSMLAISGAGLSIFPAAERITAPQANANLNLADLAMQIKQAFPAVEQIHQSPSGRITAHWFDGGASGAAVINPATGQAVTSAAPNQIEVWLTNFHRSLFLGDNGRIVMAIGALAMLVLSFSGAALVARRTGGWKRWFAPLRGSVSGKVHIEIARAAVFGLLLSSATALWMTGTTFDLIPSQTDAAQFSGEVSGKTGAAFAAMPTLINTPINTFRELTFPYAGDAADIFTLKTDAGTSLIDQGTGELLSFTAMSTWEQISETIYMLHTGQGAAWLGVLLGIMALGVPIMGVTGIMIWASRLGSRPKIPGNIAAARAKIIILVGSEAGSTWGAAATLHKALADIGQKAHVAAMSSFDPRQYKSAKNILILAATYGNGDAPSTAKGFIDKLTLAKPIAGARLAVLGFGDRNYPAFCAFAELVSETAAAKGWPVLVPFDTIDRQSSQDFARWGQSLGKALGVPLALVHQPKQPATQALTLASRWDYGAEVQAPTSILRFALPQTTLMQRLTQAGFATFRPGDLIGIVPEGSHLPRYYSLASGSRNGFLEIVVKRHPGGLCSSLLTALEPGDQINGFKRHNPDFHASRGQNPLILIGAGTGIGPLAGFVRNNSAHRPIHMFFGMRHPASDFFYKSDLVRWHKLGQLKRLITAASRGPNRRYVQDAVLADANRVSKLVQNGAQIMVCGGRDMAAGVADVLTTILAPSGLTLATLKAEGRYIEDVY